jgi:pimeloyl-ACP methyl ester carboxylesterase
VSDLVLLLWLLIGLVGLELVRPFFKSIRDVTGIILFPLLVFVLLLVGQYVYGFRPELVPFEVFVFFLALFRIPKLVSLLQRLRIDEDKQPSIIACIIGIVLLAVTGYIGIRFSPTQDYFASRNNGDYETSVVKNAGADEEYFIRTYRKSSENTRGTILMIPPVSGSVEVVDSICSLLYSKGFSVITFSQPGLDVPAYDLRNKPIVPSISNITSYVVSFIAGLQYKTPNQYARALEAKRMQAIEYLVTHLEYVRPLYLVAYGAGGAAAITYAAQHDANAVAGVINIEGPLYSALDFEAGDTGTGLQGFIHSIIPQSKKYIRAIPELTRPLLVLVSDSVKDPEQRDNRYASLVRVIHQAKAPALLVALTGAGPFDYSDVTMQYPIYSAMLAGKGNRVRSVGYYVESTAALIYNFICSLERLTTAPEDSASCSLLPVSGDVYVEYNGYLLHYNPQEVAGK